MTDMTKQPTVQDLAVRLKVQIAEFERSFECAKAVMAKYKALGVEAPKALHDLAAADKSVSGRRD